MGEVEDQYIFFFFFGFLGHPTGGGGGGFVKNYKAKRKCPFVKLFFEKNQIFFLGHPTGGGLVG